MKQKFFHRMIRLMRNNILIGLVLLTPIGVTLLLLNLGFKYATGYLPARFLESEYAIFFRLGALLLSLFILLLIGALTRNFIGQRLYRLGDLLLMRTPFVNRIYMAVRQISEAFIAQRDTFFQEAVLIQYPRPGLYAIGFVASKAPAMLARKLPQQDNQTVYKGIFVPTTPNPTSGFFILVDAREIIPLSMTVTEAMKFVVSGGAYNPEADYTGKNLTLLDKLETWLNPPSTPDTPPAT